MKELARPKKQKMNKTPPIIKAEIIFFQSNPFSKRVERKPAQPITTDTIKMTGIR